MKTYLREACFANRIFNERNIDVGVIMDITVWRSFLGKKIM